MNPVRGLVNYARSGAFTWIEVDRLAACRYPRSAAQIESLRHRGIKVLINLDERPHIDADLAAAGMRQVHLPVPDFTAPSPPDIRRSLDVITESLLRNQPVAVHCRGGLGRTGTLIACYLVTQGADAEAAIRTVRSLRPGSVETSKQVAAVASFAEAHAERRETAAGHVAEGLAQHR